MPVENIVWAANAPAGMVVAPPADKMEHGFVAETPLAEHFNWLFRDITGRLKNLEETWSDASLISQGGTRGGVLPANTPFRVPPYPVGQGALHVYLEGCPCLAGPCQQYREVGNPGEMSTSIVWNDDIPDDFQIIVRTKANNFSVDYERWLRTKVDRFDFLEQDWHDGKLVVPTDRSLVAIYKKRDDGSTTLATEVSITTGEGMQILSTDNGGFAGHVLVISDN